MIVLAVSIQPLRSMLARMASVKSMNARVNRNGPVWNATVSFEPLRSASVRSASLKSMPEEP
jgi:hypothetical protein